MEIRKISLLLLACMASLSVFAQQKSWVFLADKGPEAAIWLQHPEYCLSPAALERRAGVGKAFSMEDVPLCQTYIQQLQAAGVVVEAQSKWLNAVSVRSSLSLAELQAICPKVVDKRPVASFASTSYDEGKGGRKNAKKASTSTIDYGSAQQQTEMINVNCLHDRGFTGRGVLVAVFDAGFLNMDTISAFDSLWLQNRVVTYWDFVNNDNGVFDENNHGMNVSSTIAALLPGTYVGTAPHVNLALARTENVFSETHQEEDNWMVAVEWADSLGADIIHSSLGYTLFDQGQGDYSYNDLDGNTTIVTRAADMAAARGILVVNSAGNEGNSPWHHISAPCDADSILCVGSVNSGGFPSSFSGVGPSFDGRVKPDVSAMGEGASVINGSGTPSFGSGTSFSAPIVSGMAACLMGAHPLRNNMEVIQAIRQSASIFSQPDTLMGYGIPDACAADSILSVMDSLALALPQPNASGGFLQIHPNPAQHSIQIQNSSMSLAMKHLRIFAVDGREMLQMPLQAREQQVEIGHLAPGVYLLKIEMSDGSTFTQKIMRKE